MSNLEDKLKDVLKRPHEDSTGATVMTFITDKTVDQIIRAFEEEGWVSPERAVNIGVPTSGRASGMEEES